MKKADIIVKRKVNGTLMERSVNREKTIKYFSWLKEEFAEDNQMSKKLLEYLSDIDCISINDDRNECMDVPFVVLETDGNSVVFEIRRCNAIVWTKLRELASI